MLLNSYTNKLYIGTFGSGLNIYDFKTKKFSYFLFDDSNQDSISNNNINFIFQDSRKILWIGTNVGLNIFEELKGKFIRYSNNVNSKNSLSENNTSSICEDDKGLILISTSKNRLSCIDFENEIYTIFNNEKNIKRSLLNNVGQ